MAKITFKSKLNVSIELETLCDVLADLSMKEKVYIINYILENYKGKESPLKALAEQRYKDTSKEAKVFNDLASNPDMPARAAYNSVREKYEKKADIWKQFVDLENENK